MTGGRSVLRDPGGTVVDGVPSRESAGQKGLGAGRAGQKRGVVLSISVADGLDWGAGRAVLLHQRVIRTNRDELIMCRVVVVHRTLWRTTAIGAVRDQ
jgi:hypothetical protein